MRTFNVYDFENYMITEMFDSREIPRIKDHFELRIPYDPHFAKRYAKWLQRTGNSSWLDLYNSLYDEEEELRKTISKNGGKLLT